MEFRICGRSLGRLRSAWGAVAVLFLLGAAGAGAQPPARPAEVVTELDVSASGAAALTDGNGARLGRQTAQSGEWSVLERTAIGQSACYVGWGLQAQDDAFGGAPG